MSYSATILGCAGPVLTAEERALFAQARPWGFILFSRNLETPEQIRALCAALRDAAGHDAVILIDQEGGRVQRLRPPLGREWLPPLDQIRAALDHATACRGMYLRYRLIAAELRALGIDGNCAPMVDVADDETHDFLRNRCYGDAPSAVADLGRAVADGLLAGGVLPVLKHIPGHGRGRLDSHLELPVVGATRAELDARDFPPFHALRDLPMAMTAHIVYTALDPDLPATISAPAISVIREALGFDGLLMSDDISMEALSGSIAARSAAAIAAGCDVVLHCNGKMPEMLATVEASGVLRGAALRRADAAVAARRSPDDIDIAALTAEFDALPAPAF